MALRRAYRRGPSRSRPLVRLHRLLPYHTIPYRHCAPSQTSTIPSGAGCKMRLESRIKRFNSHSFYDLMLQARRCGEQLIRRKEGREATLRRGNGARTAATSAPARDTGLSIHHLHVHTCTHTHTHTHAHRRYAAPISSFLAFVFNNGMPNMVAFDTQGCRESRLTRLQSVLPASQVASLRRVRTVQ